MNSQCLKFDKVESSNLHRISASLIEKINITILHNERILDGKFGNYGFGEKDIPLTQIRKFVFFSFSNKSEIWNFRNKNNNKKSLITNKKKPYNKTKGYKAEGVR